MAAGGNSFIRVRLYFDYPPPAVIDCRMCWLLVDLNKCRVVADLESIIKEKFEYGPRSILNLFIEDCYLPHTECIYVVRDNDSVRVKVDFVAQVNGHSSCPDASSKSCRKRQRPTEEEEEEEEEDGPGGNGVSVKWKEKKRKKRSKESLEGATKQASGDERKKKSQGKRTEKKRKKKKKTEEKIPAATLKPAASAKKPPASVSQPVKNTKKPPAAQAKTPSVSSSDSSSSEEDAAPKKPSALKAAPKTPLTTSASKPPPNTKPTQTKSHPTSSSSSETDSSSDEAPSVKTTAQSNPLSSTAPKSRINNNSKPLQAPSALPSTNCAQKQAPSITVAPGDKAAGPCDSDREEEEIELVIQKPVQPPGWGVGGRPSWRGCSRGRARRGGPGDRRGGEGKGLVGGQADSCEFSCNGAKEPCYQTDSLTNMSVVLQNGAESAPKQDYSSMPLLAAPPQVGQKIAFKLLELSESYTPEISEYKEGRIMSFDPTTKQIELELFHASQAPVEPGKFDLVYQNPDGSETVEYAVSRAAWVTERWDSLLEPRLII
ncbi:coilin [Toxotes jaculatrix]|uniref:coilin n=1 Tax=Toxotes jaculatrix TaxID=941984 RepID=UPI001B3A8243|nr:coilin [Toxotes jaculatrix]